MTKHSKLPLREDREPGPQSVAGMSPDATVSMTEIMAAGAEGGKGTLNFQGHSYRFNLVGGVTGGGGAASTGHRRGLQLAQHFGVQGAVYAKQRRAGLGQFGRQRSLAA